MPAPRLLYLLPILMVTALAQSGCPGGALREDSRAAADGGATVAASFLSETGCRVDHRLYRPQRPRTDAVIVLAHGFLRDQRRMEGLARRLAEDGVPVATLSFCNSRPWDGRHVQNGLDMRRLADQLHARRVLYAGFSAGALSAVIAARDDPRSVGVLALDLVDDGRLGARAARGLEVPLVDIRGDASPCNAQNNGLAVAAASPQAELIPIRGASHCDFESPTDWLCRSLCARGKSGAEVQRRQIIDTSVAAAERLLGLGGA